MTDPIPTSPDDLTFGSALAELDQIVTALEGGQLELEDSIARYERGVSLLQGLQAKLAEAQQKVTMLIGELEPEGASLEAAQPRSGSSDQEEVPF